MRKYKFVAHYYYVTITGTAVYAVSRYIDVRAWRYKTARRKALEIAQSVIREFDQEGVCTAFRLCKM